jgi:hypothetical protein
MILFKNNLVLNFKRYQSVQKVGMSIWILGIGLIITLALLVQFPEVFAISREEIETLDKEIQSLQVKLSSYDELIAAQKTVMISSEKTAKEKKEELRIAIRDEGKSWTGTEAVQKKQLEYDQSVQDAKDSRIKWIDLLKEKSSVLKKIRSLGETQKSMEIQLQVAGQPKGLAKLIGIDISQGCITQIRNGFATDCPSYMELEKFDTSRQEVSGVFVNDDGFYHRDLPIQKNSWRLYDHDPTPRIIVDPPLGMSERIRLITIQDNFDIYLLPESKNMKPSYEIINMTKSADEWGKEQFHSGLGKTSYFNQIDTAARTVFHDRYVDEKCKQAIINADKWEILLPDTITYMQHNCNDSYTSFEHKEIITKNLTPQDITTSQKYKDQKRLEWIKENCLKTYGICK